MYGRCLNSVSGQSRYEHLPKLINNCWQSAPLLGRTTPPRYLQHPLVTDASGRKLTKKEFAKSLGDLRREGWTPEQVLGEAAFLGGTQPSATPISSIEITSLFT